MKNLTFLLLTSLLLTGCNKILGGNGAKLTYTGTLYKDCNRTPFANAKIVYNTVRGSGLGSPNTGLSETYTDAAGKFTITEDASGLGTIRIELAIPPKYIDGPKIVQYDYTVDKRESETVDLGELFATSQSLLGDSRYYSKLNLVISRYYQQKDSLIIGYYKNDPIIISPVPATYTAEIYGPSKDEGFVSLNATSSSTLIWATSLQEYRNSIILSPPPRGVYEGTTVFNICNNGQIQDFIVDTFSHK